MSTRRHAKPARRFAGRTLLVLLGIGLAVHAMVVRTVDERLQGQLLLHAEFVADQLLTPTVVDGRVPDAVVDRIVAGDPQVSALLVLDGPAPDLVPEPAGSTSVRSVVPVGEGLTAVITHDASTVRAAATELTRQLTVVLGVGLVVLWLAIVPLARRLGRELRDQTADVLAQRDELATQATVLREQRDRLEEQGTELRRLLDREQATVERLREVDQLRDDFLASVSHELRTPVTVVTGTLTTLAKHAATMPAEALTTLLNGALGKARRLDELVVGLLEMNGSLGEPGVAEPVSIARTVELARTQLPPCDVELDLDVAAVATDAVRFTRAVRNLIGNAVRHAPDSGAVVVRVLRTDDGVELRVEDRGPGVADHLKHDVFDPFRQGDIQDAHAPGIGMGLSIVARYAADHAGRAWLSDRPGGGTIAHLLLRDVEVVDEPADTWPAAGPRTRVRRVARRGEGRTDTR